ncbi:leucine-rich repeat domain-containing protein [Streptococcus pyogenes]|uniref:leucine-rich repeat domain-containing protein n=1 Tax=Streptococcus pyogenes TaxID=1314 RepID=UPI0010A153F5|nr:leucine-rich repeat domain-containing protein [Streptococcus pyogenes]VGR78710.1 leucine Rich Repeat family protein [Streptococcus pyogenes]VGU44597.1 leucine Rich Repeat family protein [Streptococcus pyogenes]VHF07131.1 internalin protein [Streptococcus pyogenes]VHF07980.1 internalin protein [Streptococcus pyogenes]VHG13700.1 internalin protein [Streptococcus pyogenes]
MKTKKVIILVGLLLSSQLTLIACQSRGNGTYPIKMKQSRKGMTSNKIKPIKKSKKTNKTHKGVAGVDFPTDDGFILTKDSKILSKTDQGIVVDHDGHSHFIFYADLKGSPFEYLIPKGASLAKPAVAQQAASQGTSKVADPHHHYEFNPADIVAEDALGYTVRHDDHFHYILKSSLSGQTQAQAKQVATRLPQTSSPVSTATANGIPGLHFPTSDGFQFNGQGIVGVTKDSILVDHDGHLHPISFADLRQGGWAHVADQYDPAKKAETHHTPELSEREKEYQEKLAYLAEKLGIDPSTIKRVETQDGKFGLEYPHHDHAHVLMLSDIEIGKDIPDPHAIEHARELEKHKVGMDTLRALGFDEEVILDIVRTHDAPTPFPSNEKDPNMMKEWLATVIKLDLGSRKDPLQRKGLSLLPNLETLGIGFTPIKDISPVLQFKKLKQLLMTKTGVTDYRFLDNMPQLEGIDISQNNLKDISFLSKYKNLSLVAAADNGIEDIRPLGQLPNLKFLVLSNNKISDLSPLASLHQLQELHIDNNQITDLSPVSHKESLTVVDLSRNADVDLATLQAPKLETLMVNDTKVSHLDFLKNNPNLSSLSINRAQLQSLEGIEASSVIVRVEAEGNQIKSLVLKDKQGSLTFLDVTGNQLTSLEGVNNFTALDILSVSKNQLTNVNLSKPNKTVTNIDISHNNIPLADLKLNEQHIPEAIAKNFPAVYEGSMVGNGTAEEKAAMATKAKESAQEASESHDYNHNHAYEDEEGHAHEHRDKDDHDHEHEDENEAKDEQNHAD